MWLMRFALSCRAFRMRSFEQSGGTLASADAHGDNSVAGFAVRSATRHFIGQRSDHARAGHAEGMADGDGTAGDIHFFGIDLEAVAAIDDLNGEGLVKLPKIDVARFEAGALQQFRNGE